MNIFCYLMIACVSSSPLSGRKLSMWEIIENGDLEREKANLTIDGAEGRKRIIESDIALDEDEEETKKVFQSKRQQNLPVFFDWHLRLWRTRVIPYAIESSLIRYSDNANCRQEIIDSMYAITSKVPCLNFRQYQSSDQNWIKFYKGVGCFSGIGRKYFATRSTDISLGTNCCNKAIIVHEILHSLGYYHEQARRDRDSFLDVYMQNVQDKLASNFKKNDVGDAYYDETPYDVKSIMQYSRTSFIRDHRLGATMEYKFDPNMPLGSGELSEIDILEINRHYHCNVQSGWSTWINWSPCIQAHNGICTRAKIRICMGTGFCAGQNNQGIQEIVQDCKADSSLASTCEFPSIDGHWSNWGEYTECYSQNDCGVGIRSRERTCTNPVPSRGGKDCVGNFREKQICRNPKCSGYGDAADQNFNSGLSPWIGDGFIRRVGAGSYRNIGPSEDMSRSGGYAVLAGKSYLNVRGSLKSPKLPAHPSSKKCFVFHYQMNGLSFPNNAFSMYLQYRDSDGKMQYNNFLSLSDHQGNHWIRKAFTLNEINFEYEIIFEGRIISGKSEVAVDDIFLDGGACHAYLNDNDKDHHSNCQEYAGKGYCNDNKYRIWMMKQCAATCSECRDRDAQCDKWSGDGECTKNTWMLWNCCQSCHNVCTDEDGKLCQDNASYVGKCPGWAKTGECIANNGWMSRNCYKSCYDSLMN